MKKIRENIQKRPKEIYDICSKDPLTAVPSSKTIYNQIQKSKVKSPEMKFEELYMHSFVKEAIFRKECSPIFILYNETQIKDMKYHIKNFDVIFYRLIFLKNIFKELCHRH